MKRLDRALFAMYAVGFLAGFVCGLLATVIL